IKDKAPRIHLLEQDDALGGLAVRRHGGNGHGRGVLQADLDRLLQPAGELGDGLRFQIGSLESLAKVLPAQLVDVHGAPDNRREGGDSNRGPRGGAARGPVWRGRNAGHEKGDRAEAGSPFSVPVKTGAFYILLRLSVLTWPVLGSVWVRVSPSISTVTTISPWPGTSKVI